MGICFRQYLFFMSAVISFAVVTTSKIYLHNYIANSKNIRTFAAVNKSAQDDSIIGQRTFGSDGGYESI